MGSCAARGLSPLVSRSWSRTPWALGWLLLAGCDAVTPSDLGSPASAYPAPSSGPSIGRPVSECPPEGWCWVRGRPIQVGGDRARGTAYAIRSEGTFLWWSDEDGWQARPVPTDRTLTSAWVRGADDAWVIDDAGHAWRLDGATWTETSAEAPLTRLLAGTHGEAHAVGAGEPVGHGVRGPAGIYRFTGQRWVEVVRLWESCAPFDSYVMHDGAPWAAAYVCHAQRGAMSVEVRRHDGSQWQRVGDLLDASGVMPELEVLHGRVRVGTMEWDGATWQRVESERYPQNLEGELHALHDGFGYTAVPRALSCLNAFRLDEERAWCTGEGQIFLKTEAGWEPTLEDPYLEPPPPSAWGTLPAPFWNAGPYDQVVGSSGADLHRLRNFDGRLERFDGRTWTHALPDHDVQWLSGSPTGGDLWAATATGILRFDGAAWSPVPLPEGVAPGKTLHPVGLRRGMAALAVDGGVFLFDGQRWTAIAPTDDDGFVIRVAGTGPTDIWAFRIPHLRSTNVGTFEHFDGASWSKDDGSFVLDLATAPNGETWRLGRTLDRLGDEPLSIRQPNRIPNPSIHFTPDAIWLVRGRQVLRHPR